MPIDYGKYPPNWKTEMNKTDYISGTEDAYAIPTKRVQVSLHRESKTSYGVLVDLVFNSEGRCSSAMRLEWFPMSICQLEKVEIPNYLPAYFLTAPIWLLDKKNVKY